jgi:hypothetical protein
MVRTAALATLLIASSAHAQNENTYWQSGTSGSVLMGLCETWQPGRYDPCGAYLVGLIDGVALGRLFCPPDGATSRQFQQIIIDYIKARPQQWHYPAGMMAATALAEAFPCPSQN